MCLSFWSGAAWGASSAKFWRRILPPMIWIPAAMPPPCHTEPRLVPPPSERRLATPTHDHPHRRECHSMPRRQPSIRCRWIWRRIAARRAIWTTTLWPCGTPPRGGGVQPAVARPIKAQLSLSGRRIPQGSRGARSARATPQSPTGAGLPRGRRDQPQPPIPGGGGAATTGAARERPSPAEVQRTHSSGDGGAVGPSGSDGHVGSGPEPGTPRRPGGPAASPARSRRSRPMTVGGRVGGRGRQRRGFELLVRAFRRLRRAPPVSEEGCQGVPP
eukprot:jgi/Botrbrau1/5529/Bobra.0023s0016.1